MKRRKKALLWVCILALVLSFICYFDIYSFTPKQAAERFLRWYAVSDMEAIMELDENTKTHYHLCANEQQTLLLRSDYSLLRGWNTKKLYSIDNGGIGSGIVRMFFNEGAGSFAVVFGCVDTPGAERLVLYKTEDTSASLAALKPEEMLKKDDRIYYLKVAERAGLMGNYMHFEKYTKLSVYGDDGTLIEEFPIEYASMNYN